MKRFTPSAWAAMLLLAALTVAAAADDGLFGGSPPMINVAGVPRRHLQDADPSADIDVLAAKPMQVMMTLTMGVLVLGSLIGITCMMQVDTPALFIDKVPPVNKEF